MRVAVALALQLRHWSSPVDIIDQCRTDLKEVEETVHAALDKVKKAKQAVDEEQKAVAAAKAEYADVSVSIAERQGALDEEQKSLARLELAVRDFGTGLESRRAALNLAMEQVEEKEALRNAYRDVVAASAKTLEDLEKEPLVEDTADAALVRKQHLEMKRAALAEEQERLKTVEHEVALELEALEKEVKVWTADKERHEVFKDTLKAKISSAAKLQLAVEALEKKAAALQDLVGETGDKVAGVSKAMGASEESLQKALEDLIAEQGAAVDLLEQSLRQCVEDSEAQMKQSAETEQGLQTDLSAALAREAEQAEQAASDIADLEKALADEKKKPPSREEAIKVVQEEVRAAQAKSVEDFIAKLEAVKSGGSAPKDSSSETTSFEKQLEALGAHIKK